MSVARQHIAALDDDSLRDIERGAHAAPFNVLGVQQAAGRRMLRVNAPGAWRVEARARNDRSRLLAVLDQSQTPGLFAAPFDNEAPYLLRIYWPGRVDEGEDPYSFPSAISQTDLAALRSSRRRGARELLGAHAAILEGVSGVRFALWAPGAASVAVAGDFNNWNERRHLMGRRDETGVWELFVPRVGAGARYCFILRNADDDAPVWTADPFAHAIETHFVPPHLSDGFHPDGVQPDLIHGDGDHASGLAPRQAGVVDAGLRHAWSDERYLAIRRARRKCPPPVAIYKLEPCLWLAREGRIANWRTLAERMLPFVSALGFSHIQIGRARTQAPAWFFAPPPELGTHEDFAAFVDACHEAGVGVIVEWRASAPFAAGLDPGGAFAENLLTDAAMHWLETYHVDGLSVTGAEGGGAHQAAALSGLLTRLGEEIEHHSPGAMIILEEPLEGAAAAAAGAWRADAVVAALDGDAHRLQREDAKSLDDALLPVTPRTLAQYAPDGHAADPFALLRAVYALAWLTPGMKLMHMGAELGQHAWPDAAVDWEKLGEPQCFGFLKLVRDLNRTLRNEAPIRLTARVSQLLAWLPAEDGVIAYIRSGEAAAPLLVVMNRAHDARRLRLTTPAGGRWRELLNTDSSHYGGGDIGNLGGAEAIDNPDQPGTFLLDITLPPRGTIIFRNET